MSTIRLKATSKRVYGAELLHPPILNSPSKLLLLQSSYISTTTVRKTPQRTYITSLANQVFYRARYLSRMWSQRINRGSATIRGSQEAHLTTYSLFLGQSTAADGGSSRHDAARSQRKLVRGLAVHEWLQDSSPVSGLAPPRYYRLVTQRTVPIKTHHGSL